MIRTLDPTEPVTDRPDGRPWPFAMLHSDDNGRELCTVADTNTELVGALIDGYAELPATAAGDLAALHARHGHAVAIATVIQADLAAQATDAGTFDPAVADERVLTALFGDRTVPFTGVPADGADPTDPPAWRHEVPLVLIATDYRPYTERGRPTGRIVWFDPSTETGYLACLSAIGLIRHFALE